MSEGYRGLVQVGVLSNNGLEEIVVSDDNQTRDMREIFFRRGKIGARIFKKNYLPAML
jgi:hypothetical protein